MPDLAKELKKKQLKQDLFVITNSSFIYLFTEMLTSNEPKVLIENFSKDFSIKLGDLLSKNFID